MGQIWTPIAGQVCALIDIPSMADRPPFFRDGVIARLPPAAPDD